MPTYVYRSLVVLLFSVTMLCTVPTVIAATVTVFAQEPQQGGIGVGSDLAPSNSVFQQIGDNFQISHDTEVVSVRWWGVYFGDNVVSDDFNLFNLDTSVWELVNPLGDASVSVVGTGGDAQLSLARVLLTMSDAEDRRIVGGHVADAGPLPQHPKVSQERK